MTKHTVTTREQVLIDGIVKERVATHIVTGAHGYETLCTSGLSREKDDAANLITDAVELSRNQFPVTCHVCKAVWQDVKGFNKDDFCTDIDVANYEKTNLLKISIDDNLADYLPKHNISSIVDKKSKEKKGIDIDSFFEIDTVLGSLLSFIIAYMIYSFFFYVYSVLPIGVGSTPYYVLFYFAFALIIGSFASFIYSMVNYIKSRNKRNNNFFED
ncbi:hypothetical protein EHW64_18010 [Erwinia psidii]|uniref:hypothetical protein n=1 Tax=Erwinia psidii TaxID=69224 RepID=UPI00226B85A9|nr:hypothetical protein [Erwinia psidii]MCX8959314.1 hypothetical protein [Erwinia psidii]MCX8962959.1 hypothetical protein [Erwinia psidii]